MGQSKATGSQSLVEDEVQRFMDGIKSRSLQYTPLTSSNFTVKFSSYSSSNRTYDRINASRESILSANFKPTLKTKVIIHGYRPFFNEMPAWVQKLADQITTFDEANVITVNWLDGVRTDYDHARRNARKAGEQVAQLLNCIFDTFDQYEPSNVHIIGFSLGGQAAGFAGKQLIRINRTRILGRITGLDPAGPGFNVKSPNYRLDKHDANFVDVIHTDATAQFEFELGLNRNVGHIDFYPNGGSNQAGCTKWNDLSFNRAIVEDMVRYVSCDHTRAVAFFLHSINNSLANSFTAFRCANFKRFQEGKCYACDGRSTRSASMGYWLRKQDVQNRGSYFLLTKPQPPYCGNLYKLEIRWSSSGRGKRDLFGIGKKLRQYAPLGQTRAYISVTLTGRSGRTIRTRLESGELILVSPGRRTKHIFAMSCDGDVDEITQIRLEVKSNWLTRFLDDEIDISRSKLLAIEARKSYVSQSITKAIVGGARLFTINLSHDDGWECDN